MTEKGAEPSKQQARLSWQQPQWWKEHTQADKAYWFGRLSQPIKLSSMEAGLLGLTSISTSPGILGKLGQMKGERESTYCLR